MKLCADQVVLTERGDKEMSNLETAIKIIKAFYRDADCGIFNSRNISGDVMETIYEGEGLTIDICYDHSYFEVFGLSDAEFRTLKKYYNSLEVGSEGQGITKEEIKNTPELVDFMLDECVLTDSRAKVRKRLEEICDIAIKALGQTDALDKIRAEIEQKCCITVGQENEPAITLYDVFQILDKYKAESEEE